jgi:hypothetical protein
MKNAVHEREERMLNKQVAERHTAYATASQCSFFTVIAQWAMQ